MLSSDALPAGVQQFPTGLLAINFTSSCVDAYMYIIQPADILGFPEKSFADVRLVLLQRRPLFAREKAS